jgi:hypothetical protein
MSTPETTTETATDPSRAKQFDSFATKHEAARAKADKTYHLTLKIADPGVTYAGNTFASLPAAIKSQDIYTLPIAGDNKPFDIKNRPEEAHPVVIGFMPLCFRYPEDRKGAMNYSFIEPGCWLYIYVDDHLWDEIYVVDAGGGLVQFIHVNLTVFQGLDRRYPTTAPQPKLFVPHTTASGKPRKIEIAASHVQWSWAQISHYGRLDPRDPRRTDKNAGGTPLKERRARHKRLQRIDFGPYHQGANTPGFKPLSTPRTGPGKHLLSLDIAAALLITSNPGTSELQTLWHLLQTEGTGSVAVVLEDPIHVASTLKAEHNDAVDYLQDLQRHMLDGEWGLAALIKSLLDDEAAPALTAQKTREEAQHRYDEAGGRARAARAAYEDKRMHYGFGSTSAEDKAELEKTYEDWQRADTEVGAARQAVATAPEARAPLRTKIDSARFDGVIEGWEAKEQAAVGKIDTTAAAIVSWLENKSPDITFDDAMSDFFDGNLDARHLAGVGNWLFLLTELGLKKSEQRYFQKVMAPAHPLGGVFAEQYASLGKMLLELAFAGSGAASGPDPDGRIDITDGYTWIFSDDSLHASDSRGNPRATTAAISHGTAQIVKEGLEALMKSKLPSEDTRAVLNRVVTFIEKHGPISALHPMVMDVRADSYLRLRKKVKGIIYDPTVTEALSAKMVPRITFGRDKARIEGPTLTIGKLGKGIGWFAASLELLSLALTIQELASSNEPGLDKLKLVNSLAGSISSIVEFFNPEDLKAMELRAAQWEKSALETQITKAANRKARSTLRKRIGSVAALESRLTMRAWALWGFKVLGIAAALVDFGFSILGALRAGKSGNTGEKVASGMEVVATFLGLVAAFGKDAIATGFATSETGVGFGIMGIGVLLCVGAALVRQWYGESEMEKIFRFGYFGVTRYEGGSPFKEPKRQALDSKLNFVDLRIEIGAILDRLFDFLVETIESPVDPVLTVTVKLSNFLAGESALEVSVYKDAHIHALSKELFPITDAQLQVVGTQLKSVTLTYKLDTSLLVEVHARLRVRGEHFVPSDGKLKVSQVDRMPLILM